MKNNLLVLLSNKLLDTAGINRSYTMLYNEYKDYLNFDIHIIESNDYIQRLKLAFNQIMRKSCINDRFKLEVRSSVECWGKNIHVCLLCYPRRGETTNDLIAVLKLEGII